MYLGRCCTQLMSSAIEGELKLDGTPVEMCCDWCSNIHDTSVLACMKEEYSFHPDTKEVRKFTRTGVICTSCVDGFGPDNEEPVHLPDYPDPYVCDWCAERVNKSKLVRLRAVFVFHHETSEPRVCPQHYCVCPPCEVAQLCRSLFQYFTIYDDGLPDTNT